MSADSPEDPRQERWPEDPREELKTIDEGISDLRETATSLREQVSEEEPTDRAALIEAAEEQENLVKQLEARREELLRRLGES